MQKCKELGGTSWLCPARIRQVPGSQLSVLAVTGVLFGNSEGENVMFSGDRVALPSLGDAVPSAGSPMLRRKLVQPSSLVTIGECWFLCLAAGINNQQQLTEKLVSQRLC